MTSDTVIDRLFRQTEIRPQKEAYCEKQGGVWVATTWSDYVAHVRQAGKALLALRLDKGSTIGILGFNRPEWVIADLGCMAIGGAPAGIYTTCSAPEVQYIVDHAGSRVVVVENSAQWEKIRAERERLPQLEYVVCMRGVAPIDDPMVLTWEEFMAKGDEIDDQRFDQARASLEPDQLATLIYTSGTTGPPKGVMLSHRNLAWTAQMMLDVIKGTEADVNLSYLPLSHIAEQIVTIHGPVTSGATVYFAESIDKVADNLREVRPSIIFGVPRIWEKFHAGINAKLQQASGIKALLVRWARGVATRVNELRSRGEAPSGLLALQYRLATKLVFAKLKVALGLDRGRVLISGAAPISKEVLDFFASLDLLIQEIYGQSEGTGPTSFNLPDKFKFGSIGLPFPGVEVKIADDDEILAKGNNVFLGYFKDQAATTQTLVDGWLHTGDLGAYGPDGFLTITGRKKDILITSGGENVAPKNIEAALKNHELISEAVVIGDRRKYLTALITLDLEASRLHETEAIRAEVQRTVDQVNTTLAHAKTVKKFAILKREFTIEDGELTPTLKVKRHVVNKNFNQEIEAMYRE